MPLFIQSTISSLYKKKVEFLNAFLSLHIQISNEESNSLGGHIKYALKNPQRR